MSLFRRSVVAAVIALAAAGTAGASGGARPTLGPAYYPEPYQEGFGHVRPATIYQGGDPTGLVCRIHWFSWGGRAAIGEGTGWYVGPRQSVNEGHPALAVVVLSKLGRWQGHSAYLRYQWYFPDGNGLRNPGCRP